MLSVTVACKLATNHMQNRNVTITDLIVDWI